MTDRHHLHAPLDQEAEHLSDPGAEAHQSGFRASRTGLVTIAFLAIAGFYLVTEHRAHLLGWLPWLILLACPLLHVFMHGGHGGHGHHGNPGDRSPESETRPTTYGSGDQRLPGDPR